MKIAIILSFLLVGCQIYSQKENNIWALENDIFINFNTLPPSVLRGSNIRKYIESTGSVCSRNGELLFYSDGSTIWNKNKEVMINGSGLFGGDSSKQGTIIIKSPLDPKKYIVVNQRSANTYNDPIGQNLYYSIVDFNHQELGEVVQKNTLIRKKMAESMIAIQGQCNQIWLLAHDLKSDEFLAFEVINDRIENSPIVSKIGNCYTDLMNDPVVYSVSSFHFNKKQNALLFSYNSGFEILKFDTQTGIVSNRINLFLNNEAHDSDGVFSPNGEFLYRTEQKNDGKVNIYQYNLAEWDRDFIIQSKTLVGHTDMQYRIRSSLRLGPDGKIYVQRIGKPYMGVIINPDEKAENIIFNEDGLVLGNSNDHFDNFLLKVHLGTDALIPDRLETIQNKTYDLCTQSINIPEDDISAYGVSYLWSTGETSASIQIDSAGTYVLQRTKGVCTSIDTFKVTKSTHPSIPYPPDTTLCVGEKLELDLSPFVRAIQWSDGSDQTQRTITESGSYEGVINPNSDCESPFAIQVAFLSTPTVDLGEDMTVCGLNVIEIGTDLGPDVNYNWNTGETTPIIVISEDDQYWVEVQKNGCSSRDSINIKFAESGGLNGHHAEFHHICPDSILELSIREQHAMNIVWNTGEAGRSITIESPGQYIASYTQNECPATFTYDIFSSSNEVQLDSLVELCQGQSTALSIIGLENNQRFEWNTGETTDEIEVDAPGNYTVITTNHDGCKRTDRINVTSQPIAVIHPFKDTSICQGTSLTLEIDDELWLWNDTLLAKSFTVTTSQRVSAVNPINCTITNPIFVSVDRCIVSDTCDLYLPNAVSASVTEIVDHSYIAFTNCPLEEYTMYVFDRWGNQVYTSHALDNGFEVEDYPLGVYVAKFEYRFSGDTRGRLKYGTFTVF